VVAAPLVELPPLVEPPVVEPLVELPLVEPPVVEPLVEPPLVDVPLVEVPLVEVPLVEPPVVEPLVELVLLEPLELLLLLLDDFFFLIPGRLPVSRLATSSPPLAGSAFSTPPPDLEVDDDLLSLPPVALPTPNAAPKATSRPTAPIARCCGLSPLIEG
jgi:hypothetical protein